MPRSGAEGPVRTCLGCRQRDAQERLVRLVADPAGRLKIDALRRQPGRGGYVHADRRCVEELLEKDALGRSFRRKVVVPAELDAASLLARIVDAVKAR